jgi:NAD(P)-dependent dehydrogenase (short-subunit alcohol dehydrogenase family)
MIEKTYFTNAIGPACTIAAAWLVFRRQFSERRLSPIGQCVVNISTLGTRDPFPGFFAYASSKACMNVMAHSCAKEGAEIGVRAFSIAPGAVETPMLRSLFSREVLPADHALAPERVAEEILACIVGERDALNGQTIYLSAD